MERLLTSMKKAMRPFPVVASVLVVCAVAVQPAVGKDESPAPPQASPKKTSPYHAASLPERARDYYWAVWGVDNMLVRRTASDNLIRFSYRVTDPSRAKALGDEQAKPFLVDPRSHAVLQIPVMDKVGELRQKGAPQAGKEYWMVFSNKGNLVRAGDRVNIVIGSFHVEGLIVE